ncbi:MAG: GspMb/PilO family protein [Candidatus Omnitrophica bacterium]|nr:GspMb/PilO family protein [Candidatus Omnitrophota bacterium]
MQEFMARLSKREKTVLTLSVIFVLLALLDRAVLHPIIEKITSFEQEIKDTEYVMTKNLKILQQRRRIEREEKKFASYLIPARSDEEETAALLREIENYARTAAVYLVDLKPAGVESDGVTKKFSISVSCESELEQLIRFMHSIESSDVLMQVGAFSLSPKSKQSSVTKCELLIYKIVLL